MRRSFNKTERRALFLTAGGVCQDCGGQLEDDWEPDHIQPFAHGGPTDVLNGQALCRNCNRSKGSQMNLPPWPADLTLRTWQQEVFEELYGKVGGSILVQACPGSGKTKLALRVAHHRLAMGEVDRVAIITPSAAIKRTWANEAHLIGLNIDPRWDGANHDSRGFHGFVTTYQHTLFTASVQRALCRQRTLYILDEIHHATKDTSWGEAIETAAGGAVERLVLSGTPFHSSHRAISFLRYADDDPKSPAIADYTYSYADAVRDRYCRELYFHGIGGLQSFIYAGDVRDVTFEDELDDKAAAARLNNALDARGSWVTKTLTDACARLTHLRRTDHPDAAGLILAKDQPHARAIAARLQDITGAPVPIAVSDTPDAEGVISRFGMPGTTDPWLVAVKMVSEGVDIPRLRVLVYATNITTVLFFRQAMGRVVRMQREPEEQTAFVYMPEDPLLLDYARQIKLEVQIGREERIEREWDESRNGHPSLAQRFDDPFLFSEGVAGAEIHDAEEFTQQELQDAMEHARRAGCPVDDPKLIANIARVRRVSGPQPTETVSKSSGPPLWQKLLTLRHRRSDMQIAAAEVSGTDYGDMGLKGAEAAGANTADSTEAHHERAIAYYGTVLHTNNRHGSYCPESCDA